MAKGKGVFKPGHVVYVKELVCGKVLSGEPRSVEKLMGLHTKVCADCRNCKQGTQINVGVVKPEMTRSEIVATHVGGGKVKTIK